MLCENLISYIILVSLLLFINSETFWEYLVNLVMLVSQNDIANLFRRNLGLNVKIILEGGFHGSYLDAFP